MDMEQSYSDELESLAGPLNEAEFFGRLLAKTENAIIQYRRDYSKNSAYFEEEFLRFQGALNRTVIPHCQAGFDLRRLTDCSQTRIGPPEKPPSHFLDEETSDRDFLSSLGLVQELNTFDDLSIAAASPTAAETQSQHLTEAQYVGLYSSNPICDIANDNDYGIEDALATQGVDRTVSPRHLTLDALACPDPASSAMEEPDTMSLPTIETGASGTSTRKRRISTRTMSDTNKETVSSCPSKKQKLQPGSDKTSKRSNTRQAGRVPEEQLMTLKDISKKLQAFLQAHSTEDYSKKLQILVKVVLSVQGEQPLLHLRKTLLAIREKGSLPCELASRTIQSTASKLKDLDSLVATSSVLRRWYCVLFWKQSDTITRDSINNKPHFEISREKNKRGSGRIRTSVLDYLVEQRLTSPNRDKGKDLEHERKRIKNWLTAARNWRWIITKYSVGVLFLIPTKGSGGVTNQEFENLPTPLVELMFEFIILEYGDTLIQCGEAISQHLEAILDGKDVDGKFELEVVDEEALQSAAMSPAELLKLCKFHDESSRRTGCHTDTRS